MSAFRRWSVIRIAAIMAVCGVVSFSAAQEPSPQLAELLQRLPADGAAVRADLLKLDARDITALCELLVQPGTGDDNKPRLALHGLALAVADPGREAVRDVFVKTLAEVLRTSPRPRDGAFLIEQLQWAGGVQAVDALSALLRDESLCDPAARALLAIGGDAASAAFRAALPEARGPCRLAIIDALAALHDTRSVPAFLKDVSSDDSALRLAALHALACSGQPVLTDTLVKATQVESPYERARAIDFALIFAGRLAETKHTDQAAAILRDVYRSHFSPADAHVRCAALSRLGDVLGPAALGDVLPALADEQAQVRAAAVSVAARLPGKDVTQAIIAQFQKAAPAARVALLDVLAQRRDPAALLTAVQAMTDSDTPSEVRVAAIAAAVSLGGQRVVNPLILALASKQRDVRKAAQDALVRIPGQLATSEIVAGLKPNLPPEVRVALLEVLAARPPARDLKPIFAAADDATPAVRLAALRTLGAVAEEPDVPALLALLTKGQSEEEQTAAEQAVAAAARRASDREKPAALVVSALEGQSVSAQEALLGALGRVGGTQALAALRAALADEQPEIKAAAARAFGEWPDAGPAPEVLEFAQKTPDLKHNVLALRAYARMIGLDKDRPVAETLRMCAAALAAARRPDEKKLVLARLGEVKETGSLEMLAPYLTNPDLGSEAAAATLSIVEAFIPGRWRDARPPLDQMRAGKFPPAIRERAAKALKRLEECEGYVTDWWVAGPYTLPDKAGHELFDSVFPPEQPDATSIGWRRQPVSEDPSRAWLFDLHATMPGDNRAGYLFTRVYSPQVQNARLELGSDDGIKVWLNGQVVHAANALRGMTRGEDKIKVTLREGWNTLLVKVTNNGGAWAACARLRTPDGDTLTGVYADAGDKP